MASETVVLKVTMSCQGCAGAVKRVLDKMEGVESFNIEMKEQKVTVKGNVKPEEVFETVSKTGKKTAFWVEPENKPSKNEPDDKPATVASAEPDNKPATVSSAETDIKPSETATVATAEPDSKPSTVVSDEPENKPTTVA